MVEGIFSALLTIISIAVFVLLIATLWRIFTKAGVEGWKAIIPIYNIFILAKIARNERFAWIMLILWAVYIAIYCGILAVFGDINDALMWNEADILERIISLLFVEVPIIILFYFLGGRFGRGVGFRILLCAPLVGFFVLVYLAFSEKFVYSAESKSLSNAEIATFVGANVLFELFSFFIKEIGILIFGWALGFV